MPAFGYANSSEALAALERVHKRLTEKCLREQREAVSSSERLAIGEQYEALLNEVSRTQDFLRALPDAPPRPYTPRESLGGGE